MFYLLEIMADINDICAKLLQAPAMEITHPNMAHALYEAIERGCDSLLVSLGQTFMTTCLPPYVSIRESVLAGYERLNAAKAQAQAEAQTVKY